MELRDTAPNLQSAFLFPVGEAWLAAQRLDPSIPLYAFDGLHPSGEGSYLAALVMYATLYAKSPIGLPALKTAARVAASPKPRLTP